MALAKTDYASDGNGHYTRLDDSTKERMTAALGIAQQRMEGGAAAGFGATMPAGWSGGAAAAPPDDQITKLERFGKLHADGILTDAEFAEQKRKVFDEG